MAGKRQHIIPQFLQRGFSAGFRDEEPFVWSYRRNSEGKDINIGNVGVENYFYGRPGDGTLDALITELERDYSDFVQELRSRSSDGPILGERTPKLISHFCLRARSLRAWAQDSLLLLTERLQHALKDGRLLRKVISPDLVRQKVTSSLAERGLNPDYIRSVIDSNLSLVIEQAIPFMAASLDEIVSTQKARVPGIVANGHQDTLLRHLEANQRTETYGTLNWFLFTIRPPLILGDTVCIFETAGHRRFKPLDDKDDVIRRVYLPLSSNRLIVGTPLAGMPQVDPVVINKASARCSYEFFISSTELPKNSLLPRSIGRWSGLMNMAEMDRLLRDLESELPGLIDSALQTEAG